MFHLKICAMKKILKVFIVLVFLTTFTVGGSKEANACKPGKIYAEGTKFLGICWGRNGNDCRRCVNPR